MTQPKDYIINANNHTYYSDRIYVDACIKTGKSAMKGKNAIIGVEKDNTVILLNETFKTVELRNTRVEEYINEGFKVYTE